MNITKQAKILRKPDVIALTNLSNSTIYNRIQKGEFPSQISLGARAVGFIESEVTAVIQAWCEEKTPEQIRQLVSELIKQRKQAA